MILVDAHVHIYDCFQLSDFFDTAARNFRATANQLSQDATNPFTALLLLSEGTNSCFFSRLKVNANRGKQIGEWTLARTGEPYSMRLENISGQVLYLVAGRQIITSEKLEVLALITDIQFPDGLSLAETIKKVTEAGAIPILPWGVGKWLGKRGKIVREFLENYQGANIFLGDNGGRPRFWPTPRLFNLGRTKGIINLPGSDPLPITRDSSRVGSYGFYLMNWPIPYSKPAQSIKEILLQRKSPPHPYGSLLPIMKFFSNQRQLFLASGATIINDTRHKQA